MLECLLRVSPFPDERLMRQPKMPTFITSVYPQLDDMPECPLMRDEDNRAGTGSKRLEEKLRDRAKFPSENPNPVLCIARNGKILYANAASEPILRSFDREVGQVLPEAWARQVAAAFASGPQQEVELKVDQRVFAVALTPVADTDYVNVYARDITKRKRVEEELRGRRKRESTWPRRSARV